MAGAQLFLDTSVVTQRVESIMQILNQFVKCESGATAIEYGLIGALIGVVIIGAVTTVGKDVKATFEAISAGLATGLR